MNVLKKRNIKLIITLLLVLLPWFNSFGNKNFDPAIPSQEDLSFYEINPCEVSLAKFLIFNPQSIFQDHYSFNVDNYSSIKCFGKITGLTLYNNGFVISVGTNTFINLIFQSLFWISITLFIKSDSEKLISKGVKYYTSCVVTSLLFTFLIFSEYRFYGSNFYKLEDSNFNSVFFIFFLLLFVISQSSEIFLNRIKNSSNLFPILFLIAGVHSGFNLSFFMFIFSFLGCYSIIENNYLVKFNKFYTFFAFFWIFNASNSYFLLPTKLRGFSSSVYEFNSVLSWTFLTFLLINGLYFYFQHNKDVFSLKKISNAFSYSSILIFSFGYIGANFPLINFFNFYFLGQQRYGITENNPFQKNEWGEIVSWRGGYVSAESVGEFFGLSILFIIFSFLISKKINLINSFGLLFSIIGLLVSNNRTVFVILIIVFTIYLFRYSKINKSLKITAITFSVLLIVFIIGYTNLNYPYIFTSNQILLEALNYQSNNTSSYLSVLIKSYEEKTIFSKLFSLFSFFAFVLNRSEVWGVFFARYNPTFTELLFGSGPLNLGQFYGEIQIQETKSFLLPHSSLLSLLIFVGVLGISFIAFMLFKKLFDSNSNIGFFGVSLIFYLLMNLIKNDTINYFSSFSVYLLILLIIFNIKNFFQLSIKNEHN